MRVLRTLLLAAVLTGLLVGAGPAPAPLVASAPLTTTSPGAPDTGSVAESGAPNDAYLAKLAYERLSTKYRLLGDVTVTIGDTPNGEQAVAYYTESQIVVSRTHTVDIDVILAHEVWHIIDWRDNGRLDWGEDLPPSNHETYVK